jgi:sodium transport system ATP-binding protein
MIEVQDLYKSFRDVHAVQGVSFTAPDGLITGLIGPNGAGKTTTLRILYTLLKPDQGVASVDGFDSVAQARQVQRRIGVLPDVRGLYPRLTAREHVRYFGRLHGINGSRLSGRIDELISTLGMADFADRRAKGFSRGQQLKVALARALVHDPQNVLLDEPTNGLDVASSRAVRELIWQIRDEGRCVLFSSHIMQEVAALCDRVVVVSQGTVVHNGTLEELRQATGRTDMEEAYLVAVGWGAPQ